jgi:hypothetical protein
MADALKDLAIVPVTSTDTNYFIRKVTGLKIDQSYSFKFQWVFEDGSVSDWSPGYQTYTPAESVPSSPTASVPSANASYIPVTLSAFPANAKRVDVYIIGGVYGAGKVADSFLQAGTKSISVAAGTYQVSLITVSPSGINGTPSNVFTIIITDPTANIQTPEASKTPSIPTAKSVLGAIQVTWDGKQADGSDQPYGFNAAKVYVGTSPSFVPSASNQVDVFNFANGQNIINIGVGTLVQGVPMTYGIDYYVKIATTNGTDTSTPVSATGNPKQIGKAGSGDIISILADQIETGTLSATSTITVGTTAGKHVKLAGTGDPLTIYGSGGVSNPVLSYNGNKLTVVGDGSFTGSLTGASGTFGPVTIGTTGISSTNFSIASDGSAEFKGILTASGGKIGDWYINATTIRSSSSASATPRIELDPLTPQIILAGTSGTITLSPQNGIVGPNVTIAGSTGPGFSLSPNGTAVLRGTIYADSGIFSGTVSGGTINGGTIQTNSDSFFGYIRLNSPTLEIVGADNSVYGQLYQFNNGNEVILRHGNAREPGGYPTNSAYLTLNPYTITLGYSNSVGLSGTALSINSNGDAYFDTTVSNYRNGTIAIPQFRNISAGTAVKSTSDSSGYVGDIYIQY